MPADTVSSMWSNHAASSCTLLRTSAVTPRNSGDDSAESWVIDAPEVAKAEKTDHRTGRGLIVMSRKRRYENCPISLVKVAARVVYSLADNHIPSISPQALHHETHRRPLPSRHFNL